MAETFSISFSGVTLAWLKHESARAGRTPEQFVTELLADLADPDNVEAELLDKLLAGTATYFPPVMTLEEQDEMRGEVLESLMHRVRDQHLSQLGKPMSSDEEARFSERLAESAHRYWQRQ
jgi:hypothetical protein